MEENKKGFLDTSKEIFKPVTKFVKGVAKYADVRPDFYDEPIDITEEADKGTIKEQLQRLRAKKTIEPAEDITGSTYTEYKKSPISPFMRAVSPVHALVHYAHKAPEVIKNLKDGKPIVAEGAPTILEKVKAGIEKFREGPTDLELEEQKLKSLGVVMPSNHPILTEAGENYDEPIKSLSPEEFTLSQLKKLREEADKGVVKKPDTYVPRENLMLLSEDNGDGKPLYLYTTRTGVELKMSGHDFETTVSRAEEIDELLKRSGAKALAEFDPKRYSFTRETLQSIGDPYKLIAAVQRAMSREYATNLKNINIMAEKYGIELDSDTKQMMAAASTALQAPAHIFAPAAIFGFGPIVASIADTILFPLNGVFTNTIVDLANISQKSEIERHKYARDMYIPNMNPVYNVLGTPTQAGIHPNVAAITIEEMEEMADKRQDPNVAVGTIREFVMGSAAVFMVTYPFKTGAKAMAKKIQEKAVDSLTKKIADGKISPKIRNKDGSFKYIDLLTEMNIIFNDELKLDAKKTSNGITRFLSRNIKEQKYMYGTNPKDWVRDVTNQELLVAAGISGVRQIPIFENILFNKSLENDMGLENIAVRLMIEGVGGFTAGMFAQSFDVRGMLVAGVRYSVLAPVGLSVAVVGSPFAFTDTYKAAVRLFDPRIDDFRNFPEYQKLSSEGKKEFRTMAKAMIRRRDGDPRYAQQMDERYRYMVNLKEDFNMIAKAGGQSFTEAELALTMGTMFQNHELRRLEAHLLEMAKYKEGRQMPQSTRKIILHNIGKSRSFRQQNEEALQSLLDKLNLIPEEQVTTNINQLKEVIETQLDQELAEAGVTKILMQRSVEYHTAKLLQEGGGTSDPELIIDIIHKNNLMDKEDIDFLDTLGRAKQAAREIETAIANDVVNNLNKQRKEFAELSREAKKSGKLKEEVEVIDTEYMDETGAYKKGTKTSIISSNAARANDIKNSAQTFGLTFVNNTMLYLTKRFGRMYNEVFDSLGDFRHTPFMDDAADIFLAASTSKGGAVKEIIEDLRDVTENNLRPQIKKMKQTYLDSYNDGRSVNEQKSMAQLNEEIDEILGTTELLGRGKNAIAEADVLNTIAKETGIDIDGVKIEVELPYEALVALRRKVSKYYDATSKSDGARRKTLEDIDFILSASIKRIEDKIRKDTPEGKRAITSLNEINKIYGNEVLARQERSLFYQIAEDIQETKFLDALENPAIDPINYTKTEKPYIIGKKTTFETAVVGSEKKLKDNTRKFFDVLFEKADAAEIKEALRVHFGTVVEEVVGGRKVRKYRLPKRDDPKYAMYEGFIQQMNMYISARTASTLDTAIAEGSFKAKNLANIDLSSVEGIDEVLEKFDFTSSPGMFGGPANKEFMQKIKRLSEMTGGTVGNLQENTYDLLNDWMNINHARRDEMNTMLQNAGRMTKQKVKNMAQASVKLQQTINALNMSSKGIFQLKSAEDVLDFVIKDKKAYAQAREYAIQGGIDGKEFDKSMRQIVSVALINKNSRIVGGTTMKYPPNKEAIDTFDMKKKNLNIDDTTFKIDGAEGRMVNARQVDGVMLDEYIEQNFETLKQFYGDDGITLKHIQVIARIAKALGKPAGYDDEIINIGKQGTVQISLAGLQSRLWAIASKRASYHYVMAEAMISFMKNRNADSIMALVNGSGEMSEAFAEVLLTGDTTIFGKRKNINLEHFFSRAATIHGEVNMAFMEADEKESFEKVMARLFTANPELDPYEIFPDRTLPTSPLGQRRKQLPLLNQYNVDFSAMKQRTRYMSDLLQFFIANYKNPEEGESVNELLRRSYSELKALRAKDPSGYQLP